MCTMYILSRPAPASDSSSGFLPCRELTSLQGNGEFWANDVLAHPEMLTTAGCGLTPTELLC